MISELQSSHRLVAEYVYLENMSRKHSSDCDLVPVKGSSYREPDYAPSATGHSELQPRACGTVFRPSSLLPAHSRLSKDNWKLFFLRTLFLSFSSILIVYRVLEAFSLNATLIFTLIIIIIIIILWRWPQILWLQGSYIRKLWQWPLALIVASTLSFKKLLTAHL